MARMRIYTVHIDPSKKHPYEHPVFIEEGFNWFAFLFHWMWALSQRLWLVAPLVFIGWCVVEALSWHRVMHPLPTLLLMLAFQAYIGLQANDWKRGKLKRQGHIISDIVTATDTVGATQRFFERYYPHGRLPQVPPKHSIPLPA